MSVEFTQAEKAVLSYFSVGNLVRFQGKLFKVMKVGKPQCKNGEPKTDVYLLLENENGQQEIKISYKKDNADFLENKIKADRAELIFGENWQEIIQFATESIKDKFLAKPLIFKEKFKRTEKGAITLGWKFELMNKISGELSGKIPLSKAQCIDVYAGNNLSEDKRNAYVNKEMIVNSGIANYILAGDQFHSANEILENILPIRDYVDNHPEIYFACKALNYRSFSTKNKKWDGDRSLSVQVSWDVENGKLTPSLTFNKPLLWNGNDVGEQLKKCLVQLNINNTEDINEHNAKQFCIYQ